VDAVLTMSDITVRKQAELELSEARQILSNLLTLREKEILKLMVNRSSTKEIVFNLNISHLTVEAYRQNIMIKLESGDMSMLVSFAVAHKLVSESLFNSLDINLKKKIVLICSSGLFLLQSNALFRKLLIFFHHHCHHNFQDHKCLQ